MKSFLGLFGAHVMVALAMATSMCQADTCSFSKDAFANEIETGELPGVISVFYDNGREEISCLGYSDVEAKRPITLDDPFQQCSQTKGFCGVTVAMLIEEGKLKLDDPVSKFIPEFGRIWVCASDTNGVRQLRMAKNALTVRMCLNHTGGLPFELPGFRAMGGWSRRMPLQSVVQVAAAQAFLFEPGTGEEYSNLGIDIAAGIVERVSGMRWEKFLARRVFEPLGMTSSTFWPTDKQLSRRIEIYTYKKGHRVERVSSDGCSSMQAPFNDDRVFPSAGAGLWTTARDQLKFYKMLMNLGIGDNGVRILQAATVRNLLAVSSRPRGKTADGVEFGGYSLGLWAPIVDSEDAWFGHGGSWNSQCMMNWHRRQLHLLVTQTVGEGSRMVRTTVSKAADKFFKSKIDRTGIDAHTGRLK